MASTVVAAAALALSAWRLREPGTDSAVEGIRQWDLACVSGVLCLQLPRLVPALESSLQEVIYVWMGAVAALLRPRVAAGAWLFASSLWVASEVLVFGRGLAGALVQTAWMAMVGGLGRFALSAKIARAEKRIHQRLQAQLSNLRDEARAFRLTTARESHPPRAQEDELLLHSSVDEIRASLSSSLSVCRAALAARGAVVLWLSESGRQLVLRGAASELHPLASGPFPAREGIFGAALEKAGTVELVGASASRPLPYYPEVQAAGHVVVVPLLEKHEVVGLLVLDRVEPEPLTEAEQEVLREAGRWVLRSVMNERVMLQLNHSRAEQAKLYRAVERLSEVRGESEVIGVGVDSARQFAAFHFAAVTLLRPGREHEIRAASGKGAEGLVGKRFRDRDGLVAMTVESRQPLPYRGECDAGFQVVFTRSLEMPAMKSLLVVPMLLHDEVLGTLVLGSENRGAFGAEVRMTLQVLARHVAVSLSNARMVKRLEALATTDGLTGLFNKRAATETAKEKLRSAQRFGTPLTVLVCDLDHFKAVNDTHGHDVGDRVISGFADVLRRTKRETDVVGRFGGEEFVVICEQTDIGGAQLLAERIRAELSTTRFVTEQGSLDVTCSVGIAAHPAAGADWETLFKAADAALYASKRNGRDRATVWEPKLRAPAA